MTSRVPHHQFCRDPLTPLGLLTGGRISHVRQIAANRAICQAYRGRGEIGPCWRVGSNNPWGPLEASLESDAPCPHCAADGGELLSSHGFEFCPACGEEWVVGDYDWTRFGDILAYRADREAGRVQDEQPNGWQGDGWAVFGLHRRMVHP